MAQKNIHETMTSFFNDPQVHILEQCIASIQAENNKMENMFTGVGLLTDPFLDELVDSFVQQQISSDAKKCDTESIALSVSEKQKNYNIYLAKLKKCIKVYTGLNEKTVKEIQLIKYELNNTKNKTDDFKPMSKEDVRSLNMKIKRYENELLKFEKGYPWLKDPQMDVTAILKEVQLLNAIRNEKNKLFEELEHYRGLKPDISEAGNQLRNIKIELEQLQRKI